MNQIDDWRTWEQEEEYGRILYKRANGQLAEMESSKAVGNIVSKYAKNDCLILDVGCGAGHYLVSLDRILKIPFRYHGIDATDNYIALANKVWINNCNNPLRSSTVFEVGDIFELPLQDNFADITMCNNVLLHMPSIEKPFQELYRVTKNILIVRTLIGVSSFRIKQVRHPEKYKTDGEPINYHFFNIYSEDYFLSLTNNLPGMKSVNFIEDNMFDKKRINESKKDYATEPLDASKIINNMQVNNYIIQPWKFVVIEKS